MASSISSIHNGQETQNSTGSLGVRYCGLNTNSSSRIFRLLSDLISAGSNLSSPAFATLGNLSGGTGEGKQSSQHTSCTYALAPALCIHAFTQRTPSESTLYSSVTSTNGSSGSASRRSLNQRGSFASPSTPSMIARRTSAIAASSPKLTSSRQTLVQNGTPRRHRRASHSPCLPCGPCRRPSRQPWSRLRPGRRRRRPQP